MGRFLRRGRKGWLLKKVGSVLKHPVEVLTLGAKKNNKHKHINTILMALAG